MPQRAPSVPSLVRRAGALSMACGLTSAALAGSGVQWRLEANVPVICAILAVDTPADQPSSLAITTTCNAERFELVVHHAAGQARMLTAHSSAGPVQISGSAVTISSLRPGPALTTIELASPVSRDSLSVTLQPI